MKKNKLFLLILFLVFLSSEIISAQEPTLIAKNLEIADLEAETGNIISQTEKGFFRSSLPYDENMIGVVGEDPILVFGRPTPTTLPTKPLNPD